jgi:hypothetical protein
MRIKNVPEEVRPKGVYMRYQSELHGVRGDFIVMFEDRCKGIVVSSNNRARYVGFTSDHWAPEQFEPCEAP